MERQILPNPFPGLRPYGPDEEHLFFGREKEIEAILRRLRAHRFLPVIGTSGCGKSSLVRSGLIPSLESGLMVAAGSSWRIALMRPGEDPIGHLAEALDHVIDERNDELASTNRVLIDATLRRGSLGLVAAVRQARLKPDDNVLVVVDQFEELFRFRHSRMVENSRDEAVAFVKLLLEAAQQSAVPIYVVLTMRSDFIGDCMEFPGLPEAINQSHYLVPRMSRDALRSVITGPVAVGGGEIAPRLALRLLNDLGDNQDELPLLQHVLMRMWDHWQRTRAPGQPIDIDDYVAVGTLRDALSRHAEEAYSETGEGEGQKNTERIFKALTDTFTDARGIRRPTTIGELAAICEIRETEVVRIVETFRREGRSFLMPPPPVPLVSHTIVDISHESLMRGWTRLIAWAHEERTSATVYSRLSREALWHAEGAAALWGDPELELGLRWRNENKPTAAWARRFDENFERSIDFLEKSERERTRQRLERRTVRLRRLQIAWGVASVLLVFLAIAVLQWRRAGIERDRASRNFDLATAAVDELLASVEQNQSSVGTDVPQMEQFRRVLLERAQRFYIRFLQEDPTNEGLQEKQGQAHFRLGHINRMLGNLQQAATDYRSAIGVFEPLTTGSASVAGYRRQLASAYNWLGETLRQTPGESTNAEAAYGKALELQQTLLTAASNSEYQQELARTRYNRGILYAVLFQDSEPADATLSKKAEDDFREAIRLLEGIAGRNKMSTQETGRVYNNLANLLSQHEARQEETKLLYKRAVSIQQGLSKGDPDNREYKYELATFLNNQAEFLRISGDLVEAHVSSDAAIVQFNDLVRQPSRVVIDRADAFNVRGRILRDEGMPQAAGDFRRALEQYMDLDQPGSEATTLPEYHYRFGDFLQSLVVAQQSPSLETRNLLHEAVIFYSGVGARAAKGARGAAQLALANLDRITEMINEPDRATIAAAKATLEKALADGASAR